MSLIKCARSERVDDEDVTTVWKQLHTVLFKKVRVRPANDIWCDEDETEDGTPMVISAAYVAHQVRKVIERRAKFLRDNNLPLDTILDDAQKDAFLKEVKDEYHSFPDQKRRQEQDKHNKKTVPNGGLSLL